MNNMKKKEKRKRNLIQLSSDEGKQIIWLSKDISQGLEKPFSQAPGTAFFY